MAVNNPVHEYLSVPELAETRNGVAATQWRPVITPHVVKDLYEVSDTGLVANLNTRKMLTARCTPNSPIKIVSLKGTSDSGVTSARIDRLVLEAFVGLAPEGQMPVYLDGDKANCTLTNLSWGAPQKGEMARSYHPPKTKRKKRAPAPAHNRSRDETMQIDRRYRYRGITAIVHQDNSVELTISGARNTLNLSAETFTALAEVAAQIEEMNKFVGRAR
jgi:hypothetical protein